METIPNHAHLQWDLKLFCNSKIGTIMYNNIFNKLLILGFSLILLTGCADFLDQEVLGYPTDENGYDTSYKLQSALNATYDVLQMDLFNECDWRFGEACGDDVVGRDEGLSSQMGQLVQFRFNTSNNWIRDRYAINYKGIHRANQVIANVNSVRLSLDDYNSYKTVREILGQAKFLRAFYYFNLVKTYGGVPIRPEIETMKNLVVPRSSVEEVYAYIEKDLREAAIMLPAKYTGNDAGKAGGGAAVALLMKVLMYQATPGEKSETWQEMVHLGEFFIDGQSMTFGDILKYDGSKEDWEDLRKRLWFKPQELNTPTDPYETENTALPQLHNAYSLEYKDYFGAIMTYDDQFYKKGEFCKNSIFETVFKESGDGSVDDTNEGTSVYGKFWSIMNTAVVWCKSDIKSEIFVNNDPRAAFVLGHQEYTPDGEINNCGSGLILSLKWYTPIKDRPHYSGDNDKNRRLIRFVEVILMYAEALNECGEGARALVQLNKSKAQANTINKSGTLYIGGGYGYMRNQIWAERRIELCFEWDRFFDLVRQKRAASVLQTFGAKQSNKRGYFFRKGVNEIFPIPQTEIDISNGVVKQNPGY